jgi:putative DNA primase/helicase
VAKALRDKGPSREVIIAADNDQFNDGNPGLTKATEAARAIRARLAVPQFKDTTTKPTDFNDLHRLRGLDTVKEQIESATLPKESDDEVIARLAKLPLLEYERCREVEAERLGVGRVSILDKLVDGKRPKRADTELQGSGLEPWADAVDGAALLGELRITYTRFLVLPLLADVLLSVWTLLTYLFEQFSYTPYLHVTSPEKECGKSTLGELMNHLCANATTPGGMSAASMFRRIERVRPTLLLDEWDTLSDENRQAALNVLNTGFKWNGVYTICVGDDHEDRDFHTFCPKAIFGLSEKKLPDTTRSRCFLLTLQKKLPSERVDKLTRKFDGTILRRKCLRWANDNREKLKSAEPIMPPGLSAREEDISEPLLAIADACGGEWPDLMRQCVLHLFKAGQAEDGSISVELLKDFRLAFDASDRLSSEAAKEYLNGLEDRPWGGWNEGKGISKRQIATKLRAYKIHPRDIWSNGKTVKGYFREQFEEAFCRYLSPDPVSIREAARMPVNIGRNGGLSSASDASPCGRENAILANDDAVPRGLADEKPGGADKELVEADLL